MADCTIPPPTPLHPLPRWFGCPTVGLNIETSWKKGAEGAVLLFSSTRVLMAHLWFTPLYYPGIHIYKGLFFSNLNSFPNPTLMPGQSCVCGVPRFLRWKKPRKSEACLKGAPWDSFWKSRSDVFFFQTKNTWGLQVVFFRRAWKFEN